MTQQNSGTYGSCNNQRRNYCCPSIENRNRQNESIKYHHHQYNQRDGKTRLPMHMPFFVRRLIILMSTMVIIVTMFTHNYILTTEIIMNDDIIMTLKSHNADRNYRLRFFQTTNNSYSYSNINSDSNPHKNRSRTMKNHNNTCTTCTTNNNPSRNNKMHHLRYDWTNLTPSLDMTKHIIQYQSNCSLPMSTFTYRNRFGLGSDLHVYSQALCNGIKSNRRIRTIGNWTFMDQSQCGGNDTNNNSNGDDVNNKSISNSNISSSSSSKKGSRNMLGSPMRCYFASSELNCPGDVEYAIDNPGFDNNHSLSKPNGNVVSTNSDCLSGLVLPSSEKEKDNDAVGQQKLFQVAVIESLFTRLTPLVVDEAERQLNLIFGGKEKVPKDLITVHIRWGKW